MYDIIYGSLCGVAFSEVVWGSERLAIVLLLAVVMISRFREIMIALTANED